MHQFRTEVAAGFDKLHDRLTAIEAAAAARGAERARSTAKGGDFEDVLEAMLADVARGSGDLVDRTGCETGELLRSKKGDFVVTIDPALTGGADLRVVVEAKDRAMSVRSIREELREAKENRAAAVGLDALKGIKSTLTSISSSASGLQLTLDRLRDGVIARVTEAEAEIHAARTAAVH